MNSTYKFKVNYDEGEESTDHTLTADIDLKLEDCLNSRNAAADLVANEKKLRREIYQLVLEDMIPRIIANSGQDGSGPEGELQTKSHAHLRSKWEVADPQLRGRGVAIRSQMKIVFQVSSDRPVNAMQALNGSTHGLAEAITDDIILSLKGNYLGVTEGNTKSSARTSGGEVVDYDARSKTDYQGN